MYYSVVDHRQQRSSTYFSPPWQSLFLPRHHHRHPVINHLNRDICMMTDLNLHSSWAAAVDGWRWWMVNPDKIEGRRRDRHWKVESAEETVVSSPFLATVYGSCHDNDAMLLLLMVLILCHGWMDGGRGDDEFPCGIKIFPLNMCCFGCCCGTFDWSNMFPRGGRQSSPSFCVCDKVITMQQIF